MTRYDAILFDKDGTLYDFQASYGTWALGLMAELALGDGALAEAMAERIGLDAATARFAPDSVVVSGTAEDIAAELAGLVPGDPPIAELAGQIDRAAMAVPMLAAVPLGPFLSVLAARGLKLGVVTNDAEAPARAHLEGSGVLDAFGVVVGYDSGHGSKPAPGQLLAACAVLGADPARSVMVGDSRHDLVAGRAAGMATVAVLTGSASEADLAPFADVVLPDIGHLPGWLDGA